MEKCLANRFGQFFSFYRCADYGRQAVLSSYGVNFINLLLLAQLCIVVKLEVILLVKLNGAKVWLPVHLRHKVGEIDPRSPNEKWYLDTKKIWWCFLYEELATTNLK